MDTMTKLNPSIDASSDHRVQKRVSARLRVDARPLEHKIVRSILDGDGWEDLAVEAPCLNRARNGMQKTESRDFSASGMCLAVDSFRDLGVGSALALDLHLPGERRLVKLLADVIWTRQSGGETIAGVRIAALEEEGMTRVKAWIKKLLQ